jgi:hypothetical protein
MMCADPKEPVPVPGAPSGPAPSEALDNPISDFNVAKFRCDCWLSLLKQNLEQRFCIATP